MEGCRKRYLSFKEERGSLLLILLIFLSVLMILGAALLRDSINERIIARNYLCKLKAHYLAEAGMELALTLLEEQPEKFLQLNLDEPFYLSSGAEEEYFVLQWLEPGSTAGDEEYYTLISRGIYRPNLKSTGAEAEIRALLALSLETVEEEGDEEDEGETEDKEEEECAGQIQAALISLSGM